MIHPLQRRDVDVGDQLSLHVASSGTGPPLLLLHGFTGSAETWAPLRSVLENRFTVHAVDAAGHGRSSSPSDPARFALGRFADDLRQILDELHVSRAGVLGYSMGARAAIQFALSHPDRVAAVALESGTTGIADPAERAARAAADNALADRIERDGITAFVDFWERLPLWSTQTGLSAQARERLRAQRLDNRPHGLANSLRAAGVAAIPSVFERLFEITVPVMLVAGSLDLKFAAIAHCMVLSLPRAQLCLVDGAGHAVHLEKPAEFADLVANFFTGVAATDRQWG